MSRTAPAALGFVAALLLSAAAVTADRPVADAPLVPPAERDWRGSVSAFPSPGTPTAHPDTTITFRGVSPSAVDEFLVVGSDSGRHHGSLQPHPDGDGVTFRPDRRFRPGERVTVSTGLDARGDRADGYQFAVAQPATVRKEAPGDNRPETSPDALRHYAAFRTAPGLRPPRLRVLDEADDPADGHVFLAPKRKTVQSGPMIVDGEGDLVWFRPLRGRSAYDFKVQRYRGERVLTWWEGDERRGYGFGEYVVADESYQEIARVGAGNGYGADLHDMVITPRGTALLLVYAPVWWDTSAVGGPDRAPVFDAVVQEVDIATGVVLFEWHSLGEVALTESYEPFDAEAVAYDYLHPNSVAPAADGDLLISARHTSAVYKVDRATGRVRWRLGGRRSSFRMGPGTRFGWQHDARQREDGTIALFDNSASTDGRKLRDHSRAIVLDLDTAAKTADLVRAYEHPGGVLSASQANVQTLRDGEVFVGWGNQPRFTQFSADGEVSFDARLPPGTQSYRAFRFDWSGGPDTRPRLHARRADGGAVVGYASWNGATEVARWVIVAGPSRDRLRPVASVPRDGFETTLVVETAQPVIAVRAKNGDGSTLGTSKPVEIGRDVRRSG